MPTKEQKKLAQTFRERMETDTRWLERGLLAIYRYQTHDEQNIMATAHDNGVGFTGADANYLSWAAQFIMDIRKPEGQRLTISEKMRERHLPRVRKKMLKYAGQLVYIAEREAMKRQDRKEAEEWGAV